MKAHFDIVRERLANGLTVLLSSNDKIPMIYVNAFSTVGTVDNPEDKAGLISFLARMLDEGTENYSHLRIADTIESLGGELNTFSNRELSGLSLGLLSQHLEKGLELASDMLQHPTFPPRRMELEREKVLTQIRSSLDNPQAVASNTFNEVVYQGTPLAKPTSGTIESIRSVSRSDLVSFHRRHIVPRRSILCVVGSFDTDRTLRAIERHFGKWSNPPDVPPPVRLRLRRQTQPIAREVHLDKEQFNILVGHLGVVRSNPDYYALQLLDVILGSGPGFTSRIPERLRDRMGLAYTTYSDISGSAGLYPGRFVAFISTSPQNRELALRALREEISAVIDRGVSRRELDNAKSYLTGSFVFDFQSNAHIARFLVAAELFDLGYDYLAKYPRLIRSVTARRVSTVARKYLDAVNCTTVVVGPVRQAESALTIGSPLTAAAAKLDALPNLAH